MARLLICLLIILTLSLSTHEAHALQSVNFLNEYSFEDPLSVAIDDAGRIYLGLDSGQIKVLDPSGKEVTSIGSKEKSKGVLIESPRDLFIYDNKLYVLDDSLNQVIILSLEGQELDRFGDSGSDPKEFSDPNGIFVYHGVIYVSDKGNNRIQVFGPNGVYLDSIGPKGDVTQVLKSPLDVAVDHRGFVYAVDETARDVKVFKQNGDFFWRIKEVENPGVLAMDKDGFYIADTERLSIKKFDFNWQFQVSFGSEGKGKGQFRTINDMNIDSAGKIYIADEDKGSLQVYQPADFGQPPARYVSPPTSLQWLWNYPFRIKSLVWFKDTIYAIDEENKGILVIKDGKLERTIVVKDTEPVALAVDESGILWMIDDDEERVLKLDQSGNVLASFGDSGSREGYFDNPSDIIVAEGIIYIADTGNGRVQAFNTEGLFLSVLGASNGSSQNNYGHIIKKPIALDYSPRGFLYVLDGERKKILVVAKKGNIVGEFGGVEKTITELKEPLDIAVSGNSVFVLDAETDNIKVFNLGGDYQWSFGSSGEGKGDFEDPNAITVVDDLRLLISDYENKRIQGFEGIYTPSQPQNLLAKSGMREIVVSWNKSPETYLTAYHIYRSEEKNKGYERIATVKDPLYTDYNVKPFVKYYYSVSSTARKGNESLLSESTNGLPTKYQCAPPEDVVASPKEWSAKLTWRTNREKFIKQYNIYREDDGVFKLIGQAPTNEYNAIGLKPDTQYQFRISAVSSDDEESKPVSVKAKTLIATRPPLEFKSIKVQNIFSNTYKIYENEGLGSVMLMNNTSEHISKLKVSIFLKDFMDYPSETEVENLPPGQETLVTLKGVFNNKILDVSEDTPVQAEIVTSYYENKELRSFSTNYTVNVYEKHRLMWDVRERFATFITPKDTVLLEFARQVAVRFGADTNLLKAAVLFEALGSLGLTYMQDPSNPYQVTSEKVDLVDYIQYPRETLIRKSGDCDDLVALYSASLESLGIRTMPIEVPGHMLMMLSAGLPDEGDTMDGLFIAHQGELWVPVETTMIGQSFMKAWGSGTKTYFEWEGKDMSLMDVKNAWLRFKPASLPNIEWRPTMTNEADVETAFTSHAKTIKRIQAHLKSKRYFDILESEGDNVAALTQVGIIHAREGELAEARKYLEKALVIEETNSGTLNNLANVYYLEGNYEMACETYLRAVQVEQNDPLMWINLTRCYLKLGKTAEAAEAFKHAKETDPEIPKKFRALALELMGAQ